MLSKEEIEDSEKILDLIRRASVEEKATVTIDNLACKTFLQYIEQLETYRQNLIEKLEKDVINITKTLQDGKHCDDYSRCRLKAYRTKTKEILEILKGK